MLALAALREKKADVARTQLKELVAEFPENPLFASELAKLKVSPAAAIPPNREFFLSKVRFSRAVHLVSVS
jgi:hypothetical protein